MDLKFASYLFLPYGWQAKPWTGWVLHKIWNEPEASESMEDCFSSFGHVITRGPLHNKQPAGIHLLSQNLLGARFCFFNLEMEYMKDRLNSGNQNPEGWRHFCHSQNLWKSLVWKALGELKMLGAAGEFPAAAGSGAINRAGREAPSWGERAGDSRLSPPPPRRRKGAFYAGGSRLAGARP